MKSSPWLESHKVLPWRYCGVRPLNRLTLETERPQVIDFENLTSCSFTVLAAVVIKNHGHEWVSAAAEEVRGRCGFANGHSWRGQVSRDL